jgi:hypothetical protein
VGSLHVDAVTSTAWAHLELLRRMAVPSTATADGRAAYCFPAGGQYASGHPFPLWLRQGDEALRRRSQRTRRSRAARLFRQRR